MKTTAFCKLDDLFNLEEEIHQVLKEINEEILLNLKRSCIQRCFLVPISIDLMEYFDKKFGISKKQYKRNMRFESLINIPVNFKNSADYLCVYENELYFRISKPRKIKYGMITFENGKGKYQKVFKSKSKATLSVKFIIGYGKI